VLHLAADESKLLPPYESIGTYHDELVKTSQGWRISHRTFEIRIEVGDRAVLGMPIRGRSAPPASPNHKCRGLLPGAELSVNESSGALAI